MDKVISATTARRALSTVLADVRAGQSYTITWRSKPIARITPPARGEENRRLAVERLLDHLRAQPARNAGRWTRDELYERGSFREEE